MKKKKGYKGGIVAAVLISGALVHKAGGGGEHAGPE